MHTESLTDLSDVRGVSFSNIDYNLWHWTQERRDDAGHGTEQTYDYSRTGSVSNYRHRGSTSYYFGIDNPGGASNQGQPGVSAFDDGPNTDGS